MASRRCQYAAHGNGVGDFEVVILTHEPRRHDFGDEVVLMPAQGALPDDRYPPASLTELRDSFGNVLDRAGERLAPRLSLWRWDSCADHRR